MATQKEYTAWRRFLAWVGFITLIAFAGGAIGYGANYLYAVIF